MFMAEREFEVLEEARAKHLAWRIASGLKHLHEKRIVHRDLKPENILLTGLSEDSNPVIGDFGHSTILQDGEQETKLCGTRGYVAPEILQCKPYSLPVDIWSFGIMLYALVEGEFPFPELILKLSRKSAQEHSKIVEGIELKFKGK